MLAKHPRIVAFVLALVVGMVMLVGQARAADFEVVYSSTTSDLSTTGSWQTVLTSSSFTLGGSTALWVQAFVPRCHTVGNPSSCELGLMVDGSVQSPDIWAEAYGNGVDGIIHSFSPTRRVTLAAGSHTIGIAAYRAQGSSGTVVCSTGYNPCTIRATLANFDTAGGGGGGSSTLAGLTDVNITSPVDGSPLKYDTTSSKWIDGTDNAGSYGGPTWSDFEPWAYIIGAGVWFLFGGILALIAAPMLQGAFRWWRH